MKPFLIHLTLLLGRLDEIERPFSIFLTARSVYRFNLPHPTFSMNTTGLVGMHSRRIYISPRGTQKYRKHLQEITNPTMAALHLLLLLLVSWGAFGARYTDTLNRPDPFRYIGKFCFNGEGGSADWSATAIKSQSNISLLVYTDSIYGGQGSWYELEANPNLTCEEKVALAYMKVPTHLIQHNFAHVNTTEPHFYFFAVADCHSESLNLLYRLETLNPGSGWNGGQFSFDQQGLTSMYLVYCIFYLLMSAAFCYILQQLHKIEHLHPIVGVAGGCVLTQFIVIIMLFVHHAVYAVDGEGMTGLKAMGDCKSNTFRILTSSLEYDGRFVFDIDRHLAGQRLGSYDQRSLQNHACGHLVFGRGLVNVLHCLVCMGLQHLFLSHHLLLLREHSWLHHPRHSRLVCIVVLRWSGHFHPQGTTS